MQIFTDVFWGDFFVGIENIWPNGPTFTTQIIIHDVV